MADARPSPAQPAAPRRTLHPALRGEYQLPDTTMTLRAGLAEYYRVNPGLSDPVGIVDPKSAAYFRSHDATHVVFGTHTGELDEGINDLWTIFGVDIRIRDYVTGFFVTDESKEIVKEFSPRALAAALWGALRLLPELRRRTRRMTKKWPWAPSEAMLDRPLDELRAEYGIEVFSPGILLGLYD